MPLCTPSLHANVASRWLPLSPTPRRFIERSNAWSNGSIIRFEHVACFDKKYACSMYASRVACATAEPAVPASAACCASILFAATAASVADGPCLWWLLTCRCSSVTMKHVQPSSVVNASPLSPVSRQITHFMPASPPSHVIQSCPAPSGAGRCHLRIVSAPTNFFVVVLLRCPTARFGAAFASASASGSSAPPAPPAPSGRAAGGVAAGAAAGAAAFSLPFAFVAARRR